tara:strand:+ start:9092 stop:9208 length:117 start_codon:yes stop_codon:yes gene_type:complete
MDEDQTETLDNSEFYRQFGKHEILEKAFASVDLKEDKQ